MSWGVSLSSLSVGDVILSVGDVIQTGEIIPSGGITLCPNTGLVLSKSDGLQIEKHTTCSAMYNQNINTQTVSIFSRLMPLCFFRKKKLIWAILLPRLSILEQIFREHSLFMTSGG